MGQDSESAAEFVDTVRREHVAMKTWYNEGQSAAANELKAKYGEYPGLWKEVLNWPGWKEARKEYLKHQQQSEARGANEGVPRKRKSRWGSASNNNDDDPSKRRSRWGDNGGNAPPPPPTSYPGAPAVPQLVLPGVNMPLNLPPEKQEQMRHLQSQLRDINDKLENLDREAARVDALPRGHRERSPSPPPSKYLCISVSLTLPFMPTSIVLLFFSLQSMDQTECAKIHVRCDGENDTVRNAKIFWKEL